MQPRRELVAGDLQCLHRRAGGGEHGEGISLGVVHMALHFFQCRFLDQRALVDTVFKAVADLGGAHPGGEFLDELVVNTGLHIEAVGANAGLAGVAVLAGQSPFRRRVDVGIVKDDEGRVAAQFQR